MSNLELYQNYVKNIEIFLNIDLSEYKDLSEDIINSRVNTFMNCLNDSNLFLLFTVVRLKYFLVKVKIPVYYRKVYLLKHSY